MPDPIKDPLVGQRIREYEILEVIGKGGMGSVYRARHFYLEEERAIKVIQTALASNPDYVGRFIREAKLLVKLRHPNLVKLHDFGTLEEGTFFMVLELIQGESVQQRIRQLGRIPIFDAIRIVREAALGIQEAHNKGIIHRDISPDNLLLVKNELGEEITKVIDFGIAKPAGETINYTAVSMFLGKPQYCSPEQCGSLPAGEQIDHRADIYSLGVTLYYMLAGKLPFNSDTPQGYIFKQISETPKPVSTLLPAGEMPARLEKVLMKALAKDREQRQASMRDFALELQEITSQEIQSTVLVTEKGTAKFKPGDIFATRYEIERRIGKGGMGTVYKAIDKILEVPVALKAMNPGISNDQTTLARLKREVILARKVSHPNVCRIYDIGEFEGTHYVSMEFLEGATLAERLVEQGAMPTAKSIPIIRQVLQALQEAHRLGIVHRDLKPQNILVDDQDHAHIMDFGISFSAEAGRLTATGMFVGTPRYMAPEQFSEQAADNRTDIYSIGMILFEMCTGRLPFDSQTPASVMYAHVYTAPPRPSKYVPQIPLALERIILKALEKDPDRRYQTAGEMLTALNSVGEPASEAETINAAAETSAMRKKPPAAQAASQRPNQGSPAAPPKPAPSPARTQRPERVAAPPPMSTLTVKQERSPAAPIFAAIAAILALAAGGAYYYHTRTNTVAVQASQPAAPPGQPGTATQDPLKAANPPAVQAPSPASPSETTDPKPSGEAASTQNDPPQEVAGNPPAQPSDANDNPASTDQPAPATTQPPAETKTPVVPATGPGTLSYSGEYPVKIMNGNKVVLDSETGGAASLPAGAYTLTIVGKGRAVIRQILKVSVRAGETTPITQPAMASLNLSANPSNCKIYVDMVYVDQSPIFDLPIQAGNHHIKVEWEKLGMEKGVFITIAAGEKKNLQAIASETSVDVFEGTQ